MEILAGINSAPVRRLKKTWEEVGAQSNGTLEKLQAIMCHDGSYRTYRAKLHSCDPPTIPYIGIYLTDLTFIEDGNPDMYGNLVNFDKRYKVASVILEMQQYQKIGYEFTPDLGIQSWLRQLPTITEEEAYQLSLKVEPRNPDEALENLLQEEERLREVVRTLQLRNDDLEEENNRLHVLLNSANNELNRLKRSSQAPASPRRAAPTRTISQPFSGIVALQIPSREKSDFTGLDLTSPRENDSPLSPKFREPDIPLASKSKEIDNIPLSPKSFGNEIDEVPLSPIHDEEFDSEFQLEEPLIEEICSTPSPPKPEKQPPPIPIKKPTPPQIPEKPSSPPSLPMNMNGLTKTLSSPSISPRSPEAQQAAALNNSSSGGSAIRPRTPTSQPKKTLLSKLSKSKDKSKDKEKDKEKKSSNKRSSDSIAEPISSGNSNPKLNSVAYSAVKQNVPRRLIRRETTPVPVEDSP